MRLWIAAAALCCASAALAQLRVDMRNTYFRLYAVVPIAGKGTPADAHRPQFAPLPPAKGGTLPRTGIIAFNQIASDDGKFALVEFVAADRTAFKAILADKSIRTFEKGKSKRADIEAEFRRFKRNFDLSALEVAVP